MLAETSEVDVPLAASSRDLFQHPWAWDWQISDDDKSFTKISGARLVPGSGLIFPVSSQWWGKSDDRTLYLEARVGFGTASPQKIEVARIHPQIWELHDAGDLDVAVGDPGVALHLDRSGQAQPFYQFSSVTLTDAAGKTIPGKNLKYGTTLSADFDLAGAAPGEATLRVQQSNQVGQDPPVKLFIAPRHPSISIFCGKGDRVLRIGGPDEAWVASVQAGKLHVEETDDSQAGSRNMTLSGVLPPATKDVAVTYRDPKAGLEWTVNEPVSVGLPRPRVTAEVMGTVASSVGIGAGADPNWAIATLPPGWVSTGEPVRIRLGAVQPFAWTHDVALSLGFGASGDVQQVLTVPEGPIFSLEQITPDAYLTLDLDRNLPPTAKRDTGLLWLQLTRSDLASPWTLITVQTSLGAMPLRAVKLPGVVAFDSTATGSTVTLSQCEQVIGIKFPGQSEFVPLQFLSSGPALTGAATGPPGQTEFDIEMRDASEGVIHVKIAKRP